MLPYRFRYAGILLFLAGIVMSVAYLFFDFRLMMPVFAVVSSFFETKICSVITTNIADEMLSLCLLVGMFLIVFSKEKDERRSYRLLRYKAMYLALLVNTVFLLLSILFVYGTGFLFILLFNTISGFLLYLIFFTFSRKSLKGNLKVQK
jgi:amino acid transporter